MPRTGYRKEKPLLKCEDCPYTTHRKPFMVDHRRIHTGERPYVCDICGRGFTQSSNLRQHLKIHGEGDRRTYPCNHPGCTFVSKWKTSLQIHQRWHTGVKPYVCNICGQSFSQSTHCRSHIREMHSDFRRFQCDRCSKCFKRQEHLDRHMLFHKQERKFKCDVCGKAFVEPSGVRTHKRIHLGEAGKKYKCDQCPYRTFFKQSLDVHYRIHSGEKPYSCSICKKEFRTSGSVKLHTRMVHQGLAGKIFKCEREGCEFATANKQSLKNHTKRVHLGIKEKFCIKCAACGKFYSTRSSYYGHKKRCHGNPGMIMSKKVVKKAQHNYCMRKRRMKPIVVEDTKELSDIDEDENDGGDRLEDSIEEPRIIYKKPDKSKDVKCLDLKDMDQVVTDVHMTVGKKLYTDSINLYTTFLKNKASAINEIVSKKGLKPTTILKVPQVKVNPGHIKVRLTGKNLLKPKCKKTKTTTTSGSKKKTGKAAAGKTGKGLKKKGLSTTDDGGIQHIASHSGVYVNAIEVDRYTKKGKIKATKHKGQSDHAKGSQYNNNPYDLEAHQFSPPGKKRKGLNYIYELKSADKVPIVVVRENAITGDEQPLFTHPVATKKKKSPPGQNLINTYGPPEKSTGSVHSRMQDRAAIIITDVNANDELKTEIKEEIDDPTNTILQTEVQFGEVQIKPEGDEPVPATPQLPAEPKLFRIINPVSLREDSDLAPKTDGNKNDSGKTNKQPSIVLEFDSEGQVNNVEPLYGDNVKKESRRDSCQSTKPPRAKKRPLSDDCTIVQEYRSLRDLASFYKKATTNDQPDVIEID